MIAFIIISSIVFYLFVSVVAYHVTAIKLGQHCGCKNESYRCDHEFPAFMLSIFWPVSYIGWAFGAGVYIAGVWVAEFLTKEK
jgi:hypothetical protein